MAQKIWRRASIFNALGVSSRPREIAPGRRNAHRAGWDLTFSAPKSVSLTAVLGRDDAVFEAHRTAVSAALDLLEAYAQSHLGGTRGTRTTGNLAVACFEHDTARPVGGYADVQLHTHCFAFNMTEDRDGVRSLEPRELFRTQALATAAYRAVLAERLEAAGYRVRIDAGLARTARTAQRAAWITRKTKARQDPAAERAAQRRVAREYGDQHVLVLGARTPVQRVRSLATASERSRRSASHSQTARSAAPSRTRARSSPSHSGTGSGAGPSTPA